MDHTATALTVLDLARRGQFDDIRDMFAAPLRPLAQPAVLRAAWDAAIAENGAVTTTGTPTEEDAGHGATLVKLPVTFERGALTLAVALRGDPAELGGIQLLPPDPPRPWQAPDYADPAMFTETDVTVGDGPLAVPGTLSLPRQPATRGVVLLGGSGPSDRDETIALSKPFKDLAWGLATAGIAVLRFDKVTRAHPGKLSPDFTLADEYLPDARHAIGILGEHSARVFVAGHSLGGSIAPKVAQAVPAVAGLIILAGGTQPVHHAAVRQFRYLGYDDTEIARQARNVDDPALSPATPASELPFGIPAPYWLSVRGYDPAATAAALDKPMLIIQGGRDYQVTVDDDLPAWRAALDGRADVTIRVYRADNHFLFPGGGKSTPAEYGPPQHMDREVVSDIAAWLTAW